MGFNNESFIHTIGVVTADWPVMGDHIINLSRLKAGVGHWGLLTPQEMR